MIDRVLQRHFPAIHPGMGFGFDRLTSPGYSEKCKPTLNTFQDWNFKIHGRFIPCLKI